MSKKKITGHSHDPKMVKGTYQIGGTMTGRLSSKNPNYSAKPSYGKIVKPIVKTASNAWLFYEMSMVREQHPIPRRREAIEHTRRKLDQ